jgi:hypothetical protein
MQKVIALRRIRIQLQSSDGAVSGLLPAAALTRDALLVRCHFRLADGPP